MVSRLPRQGGSPQERFLLVGHWRSSGPWWHIGNLGYTSLLAPWPVSFLLGAGVLDCFLVTYEVHGRAPLGEGSSYLLANKWQANRTSSLCEILAEGNWICGTMHLHKGILWAFILGGMEETQARVKVAENATGLNEYSWWGHDRSFIHLKIPSALSWGLLQREYPSLGWHIKNTSIRPAVRTSNDKEAQPWSLNKLNKLARIIVTNCTLKGHPIAHLKGIPLRGPLEGLHFKYYFNEIGRLYLGGYTNAQLKSSISCPVTPSKLFCN